VVWEVKIEDGNRTIQLFESIQSPVTSSRPSITSAESKTNDFIVLAHNRVEEYTVHILPIGCPKLRVYFILIPLPEQLRPPFFL
jgi:hypothetical protein